jgi:hypothetical protein
MPVDHARAESETGKPRPLLFNLGITQDKTLPYYQYFTRYLDILCKEARQACEGTSSIPYDRAMRMMQQGELDGEVAHSKEYPIENGVADHYLPLDFPMMDIHLHAYTLAGETRIDKWEDFLQMPRRVGYVRGIKPFENRLASLKPHVTMIPVTLETQCILMLLHRRVESCVIDTSFFYSEALQAPLRKGDIQRGKALSTFHFYTFLNSRQAHLLPAFNAAGKKLYREKVLQKLQIEIFGSP